MARQRRHLATSTHPSYVRRPLLHQTNGVPELQETAERLVQAGSAVQRLQLQRAQEMSR